MSNAVPAVRSGPLVSLLRFFARPKGLLVVALSLLAGLAGAGQGLALIAPGMLGAAVAAMLVDAPIIRMRKGKWEFPDGALLTGMIVAMIMSPREPWHVAAAASAIGVLSKYAFRTHNTNIFNPAALALVAAYFIFNPAQDWWGALPELPLLAIAVLAVSGIFIADRVSKLPVLLSFLGFYFLLFTISAFAGDPARVAELFRTPDLHAALFFAFFMVTDPPTSPPRARDQVVYGAIVALVSFGIFELVGAVYFLPAGLLVANLWEAWRRERSRRGRSHRHHQEHEQRLRRRQVADQSGPA